MSSEVDPKGLNRRGPDFAFPMDDAPKDGTILRLLVKFDRKSSAGPFEDTDEPSWTIGANNEANTGEDQWDVVGWSWEQDVFCSAYGTKVLGWLPFHAENSVSAGPDGPRDNMSYEPAPVPIPEPQAVAWRYRYEETGEDNEMIWSDWIVVKWKPNRSVFSTKVEIEPLAPLSGGGGKDNTTNSTGDTAEQRVTDEAIDRAIKAYCDEPSNDMRDMMRAALSTMGGKP